MKAWSRLLDLIAPRTCVICHDRLNLRETHICSSCLRRLPRTGHEQDITTNDMALLFYKMPEVEGAAAFFHFYPHSETARAVYALKYGAQPDVGITLGRIMAKEMADSHIFDGVDMLVPVPLTRKRLRKRGYNQSERLCQGISIVTGLPVETRILHRKEFNQSQTQMLRWEREQNVEQAFELADASLAEGKRIIVVDDIFTTGSTLKSCCLQLLKAKNVRLRLLTLGFTCG